MNKLLFTPGPLTTSVSIKREMLFDYGSRDNSFKKSIIFIRNELVKLACINSKKQDLYTSILMPGSGTYSNEAVLNSCIQKNDTNNTLLIIINGKYGNRLKDIALKLSINIKILTYSEQDAIQITDVEKIIKENDDIKYIAMVHHETSTGQINPIEQVGNISKKYNKVLIVDAMSSFGAFELDIYNFNIDFLISSSNKCLEGVPGLGFVICKISSLQNSNHSNSISLDILEQWKNFEKNNEFRFTPPTHSVMAFAKALDELENDEGMLGRIKRYKENYNILKIGMKKLGFKCFLSDDLQGYFITSFLYLENPNFIFDDFYNKLNDKGYILYAGCLTEIETFRIGNIGQIYEKDIINLLENIKVILNEMNIN